MTYKIRYSLRARHEEITLLEYVHARFGIEKAKHVYQLIEKELTRIAKMPELFPVSEKNVGA